MRTRRRFQPMLDSMPHRIAPSAVAGLRHVSGRGHSSRLACYRMRSTTRTCRRRTFDAHTAHADMNAARPRFRYVVLPTTSSPRTHKTATVSGDSRL